MIQSWKSDVARRVFLGHAPKGFPADLVKPARRRLERLNAAVRVEDLRSPPGHRLHRLEGDRAGQWSISVNDQFRICFVWGASGPEQVEFTDYIEERGMEFDDLNAPFAHPGEHLREDYLPAYGLTAGGLARAMGLADRTRIERLVRGQQAVTPDTALRLARVFATTAEFWMNLQAQHDLSVAALAAHRELAAIRPLPTPDAA